MRAFATRLDRTAGRSALVLIIVLGVAAAAQAAPVYYDVTLSGPAESPPNASPGSGYGEVWVDSVTHQMRVFCTFEGLIGLTTASHIHAPTAVAGTGTAGVATQTPSFTGFPLGVYAGLYDMTFDMTLASSYNPSFLNNATNLGNTAVAEATLFQAIADGKAYLNIHSGAYPGGEIRGFLVARAVAAEPTSWGQVKSLFR